MRGRLLQPLLSLANRPGGDRRTLGVTTAAAAAAVADGTGSAVTSLANRVRSTTIATSSSSAPTVATMTTLPSSGSYPTLTKLFNTNSQWANAVSSADNEFFRKLAEGQSPKILWIGCSDSRVPETVLLAAKPGEVFVHRNIANQFHLDDDSAVSVLTYAVNNLGVEHVVVVGHTNCGGVKGAWGLACNEGSLSSLPETALGRWLTPLVHLANSIKVQGMDEASGVDALTRASVEEQVGTIAMTSIIQSAWSQGKQVTIHGWLYELETGNLRDLGVDIAPPPSS